MALIEVQKSSEVLEKTPKKELANLKKEILENKEVLTKEDAEKFVKQFNERDWAKVRNVPEEDLKEIDRILSTLFVKIRQNPNDYLEKYEDGKYGVKGEVYKDWVNSLPSEDYDLIKKYDNDQEVLTKEDAEKFVKQFNEKDWAKVRNVPEEDLKEIDRILSPLFRKIRENPNAYLVKNEDGKGYSVKEEVYRDWINSLPEDDFALMQKYEIE